MLLVDGSSGIIVLALKCVRDLCPQSGQTILRDAYAAEVVGDFLFNRGDGYESLFTTVVVLLTAKAIEVGVSYAVTIGG
ncbi:hypothetical protein [Umezawaea sp.]|uniref:hypothetical protein n=1 Tax=Umezawaea sp. TaxID=1955258 RepID=UPI002ED3A863